MSEEIQELITDDVGHIRFQNMHNGNSMTVPSQRLQMQKLRANEWAARLYEGYCEIWQTQRKPVSPEFLRGIVANVISVVLAARASSGTHELMREQLHTRRDANWLQPALDAFKRDMQMLSHKWSQAAEVDAMTVQYMMDSHTDCPRIRAAAREAIAARAKTRTLEAMIACFDARIKMAEHALNGMVMTNTAPYRKSNVEQNLSRLRDERKELRSSLDTWELRVKAALHEADGIEGTDRAHPGPEREVPETANSAIPLHLG